MLPWNTMDKASHSLVNVDPFGQVETEDLVPQSNKDL